MDATVDYPSSSNRWFHLSGLMPRDHNVAHAKYTFFVNFIVFVHSVHSSFVHCTLCTFLTKSAFVYRAFIYRAFCVRLPWIHRPLCVRSLSLVLALRSFNVNSFTVHSSICLHMCSAFELCWRWNEMEWELFYDHYFTMTITLQIFAILSKVSPG